MLGEKKIYVSIKKNMPTRQKNCQGLLEEDQNWI